MNTWVVVASAARARIFEVAGHGGAMHEIFDQVNAEDRLHARDLKSDRPGRSYDRVGGQRHAMETPVDPKEENAIRFAGDLLKKLAADQYEKRFDDLCIVAPPHFLGLMREHMDDRLVPLLRGEVVKDLTRESAKVIREHVAALL
jgi:protein required for attachment to host cells